MEEKRFLRSTQEARLVLLPDTHLLAVAGDDVRLVGVDTVDARTAPDTVLGGRNVARLDSVVARSTAEAVHRGVPTIADQVVRTSVTVNGVSTQAICDLVVALETGDLLSPTRALDPVIAIGASDRGRRC